MARVKLSSVIIVGALLLTLTTISFGLSRCDLHLLALPIALGIAMFKTALIIYYYMHVVERRDGSSLGVLVSVTLLLVLMVYVVLEALTRQA